jgi:superfamily II DNA or RNA helicase
MNNQEKGLQYEKYIKDFIIKQLGVNAFLWNECPENILIYNNLIHSHNDMRLLRKEYKEGHLHNHKDIGIDIIQLDNNNKCSIVQCKNGYNNGLCIDDIAGIMFRTALRRDIDTYIYYTSCLSRNLRNTANLSPYVINIDYTIEIDKLKLLEGDTSNKIYFVKLPCKDSNISNSIDEEIKCVITPYSYQLEAVCKFKEYYLSNNRGILAIPCGCGKTYISSLISIDYKQIVILSPLREFANQNLKRFIEYGYNKNNTLLVDSDGDRDIDSIKKFVKSNDKCLISTTYKSMDLISECLDLFNDVLFIVDEFHNLSKSNILDETNHIYKLLISSHKILFMSATPRIYDIEDDNDDNEQFFGEVVYQMTFTDAITNKYITDYKVWLPSIHENSEELDKELSIYEIDNAIKNRCKFLYSCIANNGSRKCIVYCKDTEDMNSMIECMKTLNDFYIMDIEMYSISCEDSEKKRAYVLECFTNNEKIQLLFNIRILNECIDIPACDSVYISYAPKNKITTIQRISRATRIDKNNPYKVANVYIWCEEYEEILETLSSIKEYDIMFKDKVKVSVVDFYNDKDEKELVIIEKDKVLLSNYIIGVKEFKTISWEEKLAMVEEYIREYGKLPIKHNKDKCISSLHGWISNHRHKYRNNIGIMKNKNIRFLWEDFIEKHKDLFMSAEEVWYDNKNKVEEYIKETGKLPAKNIGSLGSWVSTQKQNYKNKKNTIMENNVIIKEWENFVEKYSTLFMTGEEKWLEKLREVEKYIQKYNKIPSQADKETDVIILANWICMQKIKYKERKEIMKNEEIKIIWEDFIEKYQELFMTPNEVWLNKLRKVEEYIQTNQRLPSYSDKTDKDKEISSLRNWICRQKKNYMDKYHIMENEEIRIIWVDFVEKYQELFMTPNEVWLENKNKVEEYILKFNKLPTKHSEETDVSILGSWVCMQKYNYKTKKNTIMVNEEIRTEWKDFIEKYQELFKPRVGEEVWMNHFQKVKEYIQKYNMRPSKHSKDKDISSLGRWISMQITNYKKNKEIMSYEEIRIIWSDFIENNQEVFATGEVVWFENKKKVEEYIQTYNKLPSKGDKDKVISILGSWVSTQKQNYKDTEHIMINDDINEKIRNEWIVFREKYQELFMSRDELWIYNKNKVIEYIQKYNKLPPIRVKLGSWVSHQKKNYKSKNQIMENEEIRKLWEDFTAKYPHLF